LNLSAEQVGFENGRSNVNVSLAPDPTLSDINRHVHVFRRRWGRTP
jgi:hypothetical protein